jgi:hypothetical protein
LVGARADVVNIYLNIWFLAILIGILGTIFDSFAGTDYFSASLLDYVLVRRTFGTFYEPNFYGISAMMLGLILLDEQFLAKAGKPKPIWWLGVCILAIVMSGTRSAQIAFLAGALWIWLTRSRLTRKTFLLWGIGIFGIITGKRIVRHLRPDLATIGF